MFNSTASIQSAVSVDSTDSLADEKSSARAQQMQALYELSSDRDLTLNKQGNIRSTSSASIQSARSVDSTDSLAEEKSSARAQKLQALYELSSDRDLTLNKQGNQRSTSTASIQSALSVDSTDSLTEEKSSARAQKLQALYELSSDRDLTLNRHVNSRFASTNSIQSALSVDSTDSLSEEKSSARAQKLQALYELSSDRDLTLNKQVNSRFASTNSIQSALSVDSSDSLTEEKNSARAQQLQALYELSSDRDLTLNRQGNFMSNSTASESRSSQKMSAQEKSAVFRQKEIDYTNECNGSDPLLTKHGATSLQRQKSGPKADEPGRPSIPRGGSWRGHHSVVTPGLQRYAESSFSHVRANSIGDDWTVSDEMDIRRTGSGGLVMVNPSLQGREGLMKADRNKVEDDDSDEDDESIGDNDSDGDDDEIGRTESVSRTVPKKDRAASSRAKAMEMQSALENTSNRDLSLNRDAIFGIETSGNDSKTKHRKPPLSKTVTANKQMEQDQHGENEKVAKVSTGKIYDLPTMC